MELVFKINKGDFTNAGKASSTIKKMLKQLGVDNKIIKRVVVAVYEAEVNVVAHSFGGDLKAIFDNHGIEVVVRDSGPGIHNIDQAMTAGFSTATEEVRTMGFGAGMGLPNIKKNTDEFNIESKMGVGTTLTFRNSFNERSI